MKALALAAVLLLALTSPAAAANTTWRVAVVVYSAVDLVCEGTRITRTVVAAEVEEAYARLLDSVALIDGWARGSGGHLEPTRINAGVLTQADDLDPSQPGSGCWPSPGNIAWPAGYDSVYVLHPNGLHGAGGLHWNCGACAFGSTYAAQPIWDGGQDWFDDTEWGRFVFVHEWGNAVGQFYRQAGFNIHPDGLYADQSLYRFDAWYPDYFAGRLREVSTNRWAGLTPKTWAYGTPLAHR
jgi:hypothetical protein